MSLRSNALSSLAIAKSYLDISDSYSDLLLEDYIEASSEEIRAHLGYDPVSDTYTDEYYGGSGRTILVLRHRPIQSLSDVKLDGSDVDHTSFILRDWFIDGDDYVWTAGISNYQLTYVAGYGASMADSGMPRIFRVVCTELVARYWSRRGRKGSINASSRSSAGGGSKNASDVTESDILEQLDAYRLPRV